MKRGLVSKTSSKWCDNNDVINNKYIQVSKKKSNAYLVDFSTWGTVSQIIA